MATAMIRCLQLGKRCLQWAAATICARRRLHSSTRVERADYAKVDMCTREQWRAAGVENADLILRHVSGSTLLEQAVNFDTRVAQIVKEVCEEMGSRADEIKICSGELVLDQELRLGECLVPSNEGPLELTLIRNRGPALTAECSSGRPIEVLKKVPNVGAPCHSDRNYKFLSLGDFGKYENMMYILTSNDDKSTPARKVMWSLDARVPVTVYLNFRSNSHIEMTGATAWLLRDGWQLSTMRSSVSSGVPNGPYQGPVYEKDFDEGGNIDLMGSNCSEGTYFVFVETKME